MPIKREFSWSLSRGAMFRRCPRAYYHHYYGSWGGWRSDADSESAQTHALKKLLSVCSFADSIFFDTLSSILLERRGKREDVLSDVRRKSLIAAGRRIRELRRTPSANLSDSVDFIERHYYDMSCDEILQRVVSHLEMLSANLSKSPAWSVLAAIPYLSFIQFRKPASFMFDGVTIWTAPNFLWNECGSIKGMNLFSYNPALSGAWSRKATIDAMFAESLRHGVRIRVESVFLHIPSFPIIGYSTSYSEMCDGIKKDVDDMLATTNIDTDIRKECFLQTDDYTTCESCPFQELC